LKVLFFSHQADFIYGGEVCTLSFMAELARNGVDVHFASPAGPYRERAARIARCHDVPSRQFSRKLGQLRRLLPALVTTRRELTKIMAREGITILHATSLKAMAYAWPVRGSLIWHHHDILPPGRLNAWWLRKFAARARMVLAPSQATRSALLEAKVPGQKCFVLNNGFHLGDWSRRPPREPSSSFRIALVGEISSRKGTDRLPGIIRALRERGGADGCEFVVIGEGLSDPNFAAEVRESLQGAPVAFLGRREDVPRLLQSIDLLLVPSRQDPLPTVIVEAALSGVPAVGSRAGGIPEMIVEGQTGYLAESDEEYADAIFRCREEARWREMSLAARQLAEKRFNIVPLTKQLMGYYEILESPSLDTL
jgi:glycosyltransferase involved in cell wall biosynthesis